MFIITKDCGDLENKVLVGASLFLDRADILLGEVDVAALGIDTQDLQHLLLADADVLDGRKYKIHWGTRIERDRKAYAKHGAHTLARDLREREETLEVAVLEQRAHDAHVVDRVNANHHQFVGLQRNFIRNTQMGATAARAKSAERSRWSRTLAGDTLGIPRPLEGIVLNYRNLFDTFPK